MSSARGVAGLEEVAGISFAHVDAAREATERGLAERRRRLATLELDEGATVVLTGSWGRREITIESDDDFLVVFERTPGPGSRPTVEEVAAGLGGPSPGREGIFKEQVSLEDLRDKIGRDEDTNANLTRRMLVILESVAVCRPEVHARARRTLLSGYLIATKDHRPPRFLLNDLVRYWRTVAVDFESKTRKRRGEGWGLRNAKLRLSRKALFAGGLLPVLECHRYSRDTMLDYLDERMAVPPLDRLADAFVDHDAVDPGIRVLNAYDEFLAILDDGSKRQQLDRLDQEKARGSGLFSRVAELGEEFEAGLLALLFDEPELRRWVRDYLIF